VGADGLTTADRGCTGFCRFDGSTIVQNCRATDDTGAGGVSLFTGSFGAISNASSTTSVSLTVTAIDATNVTVLFTKAGSPTGTGNFRVVVTG